jgi:predicted ATPase
MIDKVRLQNFKGHIDTEVRLGRLTMLVGDNASGKTSVLEALWLQAAMHPLPSSALIGDRSLPDLVRRGSDGQVILTSEGRAQEPWSTTISLSCPRSDSTQELRKATLNGHVGGRGFSKEQTFQSATDDDGANRNVNINAGGGQWDELDAILGSTRIYRLRAEQVAAASYSHTHHPEIKADGTYTAVVLAALKLGRDELFERIESAMRTLIPSIERVRLRPATTFERDADQYDTYIGHKIFFDFVGAPDVPAHGASHGTLIVLALLTILFSPNRPKLILLDDFDHALHPRAQIELVKMIKGLLALEEFRELQIVATTHSPYTLDQLDPEDVQAFALRDDGTVASKRLSEHPQAKQTKGTLTAGQLWSLDPERDWVLGG